MDRSNAIARDEADALAHYRNRFVLPEGVIYLDGNSLGAQAKTIPGAAGTVLGEWRDRLIGGWDDAGWWELPVTVGGKIARLIGAARGTVLVADTTTTNLFKALHAALEMRPGRPVVLIEEGAFPTDLYVTASVASGSDRRLRVVPRGERVADHLDGSVAVAVLNHVDFRTAEILDMALTTQAALESGALTIWDLSHSAGVLPLSVAEARVDFAVGCTYKYLNGGPGAPAYVYVSPAHLQTSRQPIAGWLGHADPFLMVERYEPAPGVRRFLTGTQPIVSMRLLDAALDVYAEADLAALRAKSMELTDLFISLVDERCEGVEVISPRPSERRGSQVSLRHPDAPAIFGRLVGAGLRGDFRAPDILRFGFAPLYVRYVDVWDAVEVLRQVLG